MSKFSINNTQRKGQSGFTLIELVVVMVILGILAATALPKFADLGSDARIAKMKAASAAIQAGSALAHSTWLARGSPAAGALDGVDMNAAGYPTATATGIQVAAGGLADYVFAAGVVTPDATHSTCKVTYTADGVAPVVALAVADCD